MGLGDKAAAFALLERAMDAIPIERDALDDLIPIETLAQVAAQTSEPDRDAISALQRLLSIHCGMIRASKSSASKSRCDYGNQSLRKARSNNLAWRNVTSLPRLVFQRRALLSYWCLFVSIRG